MNGEAPSSGQFVDLSQLAQLAQQRETIKAQIEQARALGQPSGRKYSTWGGALAGGLGDILGGIAGQTKEARLAEELGKNRASEQGIVGGYNTALMGSLKDPEMYEKLALQGISSGNPALASTGQAALLNENRTLVRSREVERDKQIAADREADNARLAAALKQQTTHETEMANIARENAKTARAAADRGRLVPAVIHDPVTGKEMAASFDPTTGTYKPTEYEAPPKAGGFAGEKFKAKALNDLADDLDPYHGGASSSAALNQTQVNAAERVETLLHSPGPITPQRVEELIMMAATVAAGGHQPTESQVKGMYTKTFKGDLAEFAQYVTSNPSDAGVGEILKQIGQQSEREKVTARAQMRRAFLSQLTKHPQAFKEFPTEAHAMAKNAGLEGLYNRDTLEPLQEIDPVKEAGKMSPGESPQGRNPEQLKAQAISRIAQLKHQGMTKAQIIKTLADEGLTPNLEAPK